MQLKVTTWNINSVRLRIDLVAKFIKAVRPDVLCLQETKCPDDAFPLKRFKRLGYEHVALNGQKGYHGVSVVSRLPFDTTNKKGYCGKTDARHVGVTFGEKAGLRDPLTVHNYYVPAGGDEPDPQINPKFAHKLSFLDELRECQHMLPAPNERSIVVGDLNVAPLECDVWSHKAAAQGGVAHADRMREADWRRRRPATGSTRRALSCASRRSSTPGGATARRTGRLPTRAGGSIISGFRQALGDRLAGITVAKDARGWARPSDHVPVTVTLDV